MSDLHTLLAATDLSAPSRHAALRAAMLARQTGAQLELMHVLEKGALDALRRLLGDDGDALPERIRAQAQESLTQLCTEVGATLGASVGQHLEEGAVVERRTLDGTFKTLARWAMKESTPTKKSI